MRKDNTFPPDLLAQTAQMIQDSFLDDKTKQRFLDELREMSEGALEALHDDLVKLRKEYEEAFHQNLEEQMERETEASQKLQRMYEAMGTRREEVESMSHEEQIPMTPENIAKILESEDHLRDFLISIGPQGMKQVEKSVKALKDDPRQQFDPEKIDRTVARLRELSAELNRIANTIGKQMKNKYQLPGS
ncbi:MAG: hypothetical protein Q8O95_03270 [bacterium]|nr:hypothetical protein [bacterium]